MWIENALMGTFIQGFHDEMGEEVLMLQSNKLKEAMDLARQHEEKLQPLRKWTRASSIRWSTQAYTTLVPGPGGIAGPSTKVASNSKEAQNTISANPPLIS